MIKIAPSILSADFANLERDIRRVSSADWLHVDVMDGCFVPNLTIGVPVVQSIRKCTGMFLDVHLMIDKPVRYVEAFAQAGADLLSVHLEADHPTGIAEALRRMEACKVKKAVALRPITAPSAVLPYLEGTPSARCAPSSSGTTPPAVWRWTAGSTPRRPRRSWPPVRTPWWPARRCTARPSRRWPSPP